jgi:hypothetical protein
MRLRALLHVPAVLGGFFSDGVGFDLIPVSVQAETPRPSFGLAYRFRQHPIVARWSPFGPPQLHGTGHIPDHWARHRVIDRASNYLDLPCFVGRPGACPASRAHRDFCSGRAHSDEPDGMLGTLMGESHPSP